MMEVNNKHDLEVQLKKNKRVLALFYASWCPYCKSFLATFDETIRKRNFACVLRVNMDDYDNPLWEDYSVEAVPTVVLFEEGRVCRRLDGQLGEGLKSKQFDDWIEETWVLAEMKLFFFKIDFSNHSFSCKRESAHDFCIVLRIQ